jgi:hypothetical protein
MEKIMAVFAGCCAITASGQSLVEYKCSFCVASVDEAKHSDTPLLSACSSLFAKEICETFNLDFKVDSYGDISSRNICELNKVCDAISSHGSESESLDIRVSKGYGSRGYDKVRLSVISNETIESPLFSYTEKFMFRWTENYLHTGIVSVKPGEKTSFTIGSESFDVFVPTEGEGTRGVLLADPCFTSEFVTCKYGLEFSMFNHTIELLNAINSHEDNHFWMILGDNFYDQSGEVSNVFVCHIMDRN